MKNGKKAIWTAILAIASLIVMVSMVSADYQQDVCELYSLDQGAVYNWCRSKWCKQSCDLDPAGCTCIQCLNTCLGLYSDMHMTFSPVCSPTPTPSPSVISTIVTPTPVTPTPYCTEGFLNEIICVGYMKKQEYQYSDCSLEWRTIESDSPYCKGSPSTPMQTSTSTPSLIVSPSKPGTIVINSNVDGIDIFLNDSHETKSAGSRATITTPEGSYKLRASKVGYTECTQNVTVNPDGFVIVNCDLRAIETAATVTPTALVETALPTQPKATQAPSCTAGFLNESVCIDRTKKQKYQYADCSWNWKTAETNSSYCADSTPVPTPTKIPTLRQPGFEVVFATIGLLAAAYIIGKGGGGTSFTHR